MYIDRITFDKILVTNASNKLVCTFVKILWHTGARLVEILDITPKDIFSNKSYIQIKNKRKRTRVHDYYRQMNIPKDLINDLRILTKLNQVKDNEKIFQFTPKTAINYIRIACLAAGIEEKVTPKTFRYSFSKNLIEIGISDFELSYLLGNIDIKKTNLYRNIISKKDIA